MLPPFPPADAHPLEVLLYVLKWIRSTNGEGKCYLDFDSFNDTTWIRFLDIPNWSRPLEGPYTLMEDLQERLEIPNPLSKVYTTVSVMTNHIEYLWEREKQNLIITSTENSIPDEDEDSDEENDEDDSFDWDDDEDDEERIMRSLDSGDGDLHGY